MSIKKLNVVKSVRSEKKKSNTEKRIFFSLILCVCAVVLVSAFSALNTTKEMEDEGKEINAREVKSDEIKNEIPSVKISEEVKEETVKEEKKEEVPKVEIEAPKTQEEIMPPKVEEVKITTIAKPVSGEILKMFSDKKPVYSKTMQDWRVHDGIDIKANIGESVFCCLDGKVEDVYEDKLMGMTVIINHGKLTSKYQNLSPTNIIQKGKEVKKGEAIGIVGDSAQAEISDASHLHFELLEGKIQQNPENMFE
ncbi:MAG: hypothetical protein E7404_01805 [Ruminococcaceae bacterium]|nr:hypothetical protein [Oscillospiraceae bacterium]